MHPEALLTGLCIDKAQGHLIVEYCGQLYGVVQTQRDKDSIGRFLKFEKKCMKVKQSSLGKIFVYNWVL